MSILHFLWVAGRFLGRIVFYCAVGVGALLLLAVIVFKLRHMSNSESRSAAYVNQTDVDPRQIDFREAFIDSEQLADDNAYIRITGVYIGLGTLNMLAPPTYTPLSADMQTIDLIVDDDARNIKAFFYDCQRRANALTSSGNYNENACIVQVTGHMTDCYLKIAPSATRSCLHVEHIERVTSR